MLITARAGTGSRSDRGVVGHARSSDLRHWAIQPPLSRPDAGFGQLEVTQVEEVEGRAVLLFSCLASELSPARRERGETGGIWAVPAPSTIGPFDLTLAYPLTGPEFYSGRIIPDREGRWVLLAFVNHDAGGAFAGGLSDPMPVGWTTGPDNVTRLTLGGHRASAG
jgi:beta-fructofuranosidase